jgi:uncharacterized protein
MRARVTVSRWVFALLLAVGLARAADAAEVAIPPAPTAWVTDTAGFLKPQTVASLDARLQAYEATTGHQVLVYVAPTTGVAPTEDWTVRAFARWKVGRKGIDDGLVIFVFPNDHKVRIEVGYGLEQTVPDAIAARIIRNTILPEIRAGEPDRAVSGGVDQLLAVIGGEATPQAATPQAATPAAGAPAPAPTSAYDDSDSGQNPFAVALGVIIALLVIVLVMWLISKLPRVPDTYISGGNSGSGWWDVLSIGAGVLGGLSGGSGGGFSGGGGGGGGGGASGSW